MPRSIDHPVVGRSPRCCRRSPEFTPKNSSLPACLRRRGHGVIVGNRQLSTAKPQVGRVYRKNRRTAVAPAVNIRSLVRPCSVAKEVGRVPLP